MMEDRKMDQFSKFIMDEIKLESPSKDFISNVMKSVEVESEKSRLLVYKPLIHKSVWGLIIILFLALSVYIFTGSTVNYYLLSTLDINALNELSEIDLFKHISFSRIFTFSFILFAALAVVQLFAIKNYFNKQNLV